jgi:hypothetical protein
MDQQTHIITFEGVSPADAHLYAEELRDALLDATPDVKVDRRRDDPHTQDFGATLVLVLGAPAVVVIAKAIGNWLSRYPNRVGITIKTPEGEIIGTDLTSKDAVKLAELLLSRK